jgi:hypothetical protein
VEESFDENVALEWIFGSSYDPDTVAGAIDVQYVAFCKKAIAVHVDHNAVSNEPCMLQVLQIFLQMQKPEQCVFPSLTFSNEKIAETYGMSSCTALSSTQPKTVDPNSRTIPP